MSNNVLLLRPNYDEMIKRNAWFPFYVSLMLIAGMAIGIKTGQRFPYFLRDKNPVYNQDKTLQEVIRYINGKYVDEVSFQNLSVKTIDKLLESLDPHTTLIPAADLRVVNEQLDDNFEGIGVEYLMNKDTIQIINAIPGGPSEKLGISAGDRIVTVGDSLVAGVGIETNKIVRMLRGAKGTKVKVGILRGRNLLSFEITRDAIPNHSVDAGFMLNEVTGYIKINKFSESTYREFMEKLEPMVEKQGMKDLIMDLRGNPGGYLNKAVDILNQCFKEKDKLLLYTEGKNSKKQTYQTNGQAFYDIEKIAVLIDEGSASASEIVAGALQDWDRATIVGRRSFGKGLVQEQYPLSDGSALRLSIARYFTPSGRCIQKPYKGNLHYADDIENRRKNGEMKEQQTFVDSLPEFITANGKKVHAGGGVAPDVFVPADPVFDMPFFLKLKEHMEPFAMNCAQYNRQQWNMGSDAFINAPLSQNVFNSFVDYCTRGGLKVDKSALQQCEATAKNLLKASLGRVLFNEEVKFIILAREDSFVKAALKSK